MSKKGFVILLTFSICTILLGIGWMTLPKNIRCIVDIFSCHFMGSGLFF